MDHSVPCITCITAVTLGFWPVFIGAYHLHHLFHWVEDFSTINQSYFS